MNNIKIELESFVSLSELTNKISKDYQQYFTKIKNKKEKVWLFI